MMDTVEQKSKREIARDALKAILEKSGSKLLMPEDVVDAAAHPDHPLHPEFEWDDTEAARLHRLTQARTLIRSIPVIYVQDDRPIPDGEKGVIKVRKYHSLPSDRKDGGGYREMEDIVESKEMLEELLDTAKAEVDAVLRRYEIFKELGESVREAMANVKAKPKRPRKGKAE